MKCTLEDLVKAKTSFDKIIKQDIDISVAFDIKKKIRPILVEFKDYEDAQKKLFEKYGELRGQQYFIKPENSEVANTELKQLLEKEVKVDIQKIEIDVLKKQNIRLSIEDLMNLEEFIK